MHGWVPGPRSLRGARTLLGFPSPAAPLSTPAVLSSSEERCFFMPEPGALVLLCTMQIPALLSADVGSARPRRPAPPLRAHRPGPPLAHSTGAVKPAEGSLPGRGPVRIQSAVSKRPERVSRSRHLLHAGLPPRSPRPPRTHPWSVRCVRGDSRLL